MTHKFSRNPLLTSVALPFIAILIMSLAFLALAQTTMVGGRFAERAFGPAPSAAASQTAPVHFAKAVAYPSGGGLPWSTVVADVNGDGKPDLVVGNECAAPDCPFGSVGVLLGNGDGTFQPATAFDSGGDSFSLAVTDVNNDGNPDIVVLNTCNGCANSLLSVLLGNGDGTFQAPVSYSTGGVLPGYGAAVVIADVNGDGNPDLIATTAGGVAVLLSNGNGTFQSAVNYSSGGSDPVSVVVGDVNGDGRPDLVVANRDSSSVSVLLGNGDGTFQTAVTYSSGGEYPQSVAIGDLNGDGKLDLAVANGCRIGKCSSGEVSVLLGNGDGTFQPPSSFNSVRRYAFSVAVGDVNGDGKPALVVASGCPPTSYYTECNYPGEVSVLLGNGDGTFQPPVSYYSGGWYPLSVAIADVNADTKPDLVVTSICGFDNCLIGSVGVLLNNFTARTTSALTSSLNPSFVNQSVTFTVTVTSNPPVPDEQIVTFRDGPTEIGTGTTKNGVATFTTSSLSSKTHTIKASYPGDLFHKASSGSVTQVVNGYATSTTLASSLNPSQFGQAVTFTATVTPSGPYAPTGWVKFLDGTVGIGTTKLSAGAAKLTTSTLAVGTHPITAEYLGDAFNASSTSPVLNQVVQ